MEREIKLVVFIILVLVILSINAFYLESRGNNQGEIDLDGLEEYSIEYKTYTTSTSDTEFLLKQEGKTGNDGLKIISNTLSDSMYILTISNLSPNEFYKFSAYVKVDKLEERDGYYGVNIGENNSWVSSKQIIETNNNWEKLEVTIRSNKNGVIKLNLRIGFWNNLSRGTATFDDIGIEKITDSSESKKIIRSDDGDVRVVLDKSVYDSSNISNEKAKEWVNRLSKVKECYKDLVGQHPYDGKVDIVAGNYYNAYAIAGDPIQWIGKNMAIDLSSIEENDDWLFGILHEIGHNYDLDGRWNFDAEVFANFKMIYVLEKLNGKVVLNYSNPYIGDEIKQHYKKTYDKTGLKEIDGMVYKLIDIKDIITDKTNENGWEAYKSVFRYFNELSSNNIPGTQADKFKLFIEKLSDYSGINIRNEFSVEEWKDVEDKYGKINYENNMQGIFVNTTNDNTIADVNEIPQSGKMFGLTDVLQILILVSTVTLVIFIIKDKRVK